MSNERDALAALEERVTRLEYRARQMLALHDHPRDSFPRFILDSDLDARQVQGIEEVMEAT